MMQSILEGHRLPRGRVIGAMEICFRSRDGSRSTAASNNGYFCEFLSRVLNRVLSVPATVEIDRSRHWRSWHSSGPASPRSTSLPAGPARARKSSRGARSIPFCREVPPGGRSRRKWR